MAIPAAFVLFFVGIAAYVVAFLGWWAALFTGKLPTWAFDFLTGFVRWTARVHAYSSLLTDRYPPFSLDDDPYYPVRLVTRPTRLNRAAVFFRVILVIPAGIVAVVAAFGMGILSFFGWLIALFTGKLPDSLHEAFAAIVRYYVRYLGYYLMITPEYPAGLYGDQTAATAASAPAWKAAGGGHCGRRQRLRRRRGRRHRADHRLRRAGRPGGDRAVAAGAVQHRQDAGHRRHRRGRDRLRRRTATSPSQKSGQRGRYR